MLQLLHMSGVVPRAREAAAACEADYPVVNPHPFQENLRAAFIDGYTRTVRPHPRLADQAAAFADTIIAQFSPEYVEPALQRAAGGGFGAFDASPASPLARGRDRP